jgi:succinylglutamate desuccinylase
MVTFTSCATPKVDQSPVPQQDQIYQGLSLEQYFAKFRELEKQHPGPINSSIQLKAKKPKGPHFVIGCAMHGDEIGCLPPVIEAIEEILSGKITFNGTLTVFWGNRKASLLNKRFLEQDLNRVFLEQAPASYEKDRAKEIMPLLLSADLFVDFHQTIESTDKAFYTFAFHAIPYHWAKYLEGADTLVTRAANVTFAAGSLSGTEYATEHGIPALTLEASQKGLSQEAFDHDFKVINRAITALNKMGKDRRLSSLIKFSRKSNELTLLKRVANQPFTDPKVRLKAGYKNFSHVTKGEAIGFNPDASTLTAPANGYLLFPKYPVRNANGEALQPLPSDLYLLLQEATIKEFKKQ